MHFKSSAYKTLLSKIQSDVTEFEDAKAADRLFDDLMGDAVVPRKKFIKDHSDEAKYHI